MHGSMDTAVKNVCIQAHMYSGVEYTYGPSLEQQVVARLQQQSILNKLDIWKCLNPYFLL